MLGRKYRNHWPLLLCFITIFYGKNTRCVRFFEKIAYFASFYDERYENCHIW